MDKKGDEKYYIIISLILGLIILAISLYFIFQEYFTQDELNWETCRQSIIMRGIAPEKDLGAVISGKDLFPLKCQTQPININYNNTQKAEKAFADAIANCRYMLGEGNYRIFSSQGTTLGNDFNPCFICARIHLDNGAINYYSGGNVIDLKRALNLPFQNGQTYFEYLNPDSDARAFNYFKGWGYNFYLDIPSGSSLDTSSDKVSISKRIGTNNQVFIFPQFLYPKNGDLLIIYSEPRKLAGLSSEYEVSPYIIILQQSDIANLNNNWGLVSNKVCSSIQTVPA